MGKRIAWLLLLCVIIMSGCNNTTAVSEAPPIILPETVPMEPAAQNAEGQTTLSYIIPHVVDFDLYHIKVEPLYFTTKLEVTFTVTDGVITSVDEYNHIRNNVPPEIEFVQWSNVYQEVTDSGTGFSCGSSYVASYFDAVAGRYIGTDAAITDTFNYKLP